MDLIEIQRWKAHEGCAYKVKDFPYLVWYHLNVSLFFPPQPIDIQLVIPTPIGFNHQPYWVTRDCNTEQVLSPQAHLSVFLIVLSIHWFVVCSSATVHSVRYHNRGSLRLPVVRTTGLTKSIIIWWPRKKESPYKFLFNPGLKDTRIEQKIHL